MNATGTRAEDRTTATRVASPVQEYLTDLLAHAREYSRAVKAARHAVVEGSGASLFEDRVGDLSYETARLCALVGAVAVRRAERMLEANGEWLSVIGEMEEPTRRDYFRRLFEDAGISDDFAA